MQALKMQWWPESAQGTCLFSETGRKAEVLNDFRLWRQAKSQQRGSARRTQGPSASNALLKAKGGSGAVGWNSPPGNPRFSREEENRIRIGHHHPPNPSGCRGLTSLHLPAQQLLARESRGTPGIRWGSGGGLPAAALGAERRKNPPGNRRGRMSLDHNFVPQNAGWPRFHAYAAPAESARPGTPSVWERREENRR